MIADTLHGPTFRERMLLSSRGAAQNVVNSYPQKLGGSSEKVVPAGEVPTLQWAVMGIDDGESEAGALGADAGGIGSAEAAEDALQRFFRDAGPLVGDLDDGSLAARVAVIRTL